MMLRLEDAETLERDARGEYDHPIPQKILDGRKIRLSRNDSGLGLKPNGIILVTAFDLSVPGNKPHCGSLAALNSTALRSYSRLAILVVPIFGALELWSGKC